MARRFGRFEVKNEMTDGGKIRPDDSYKQNGGKISSEQQKEIIEDAEKSGGFDDFDFEFEQDDIEFEETSEPEIEEKEVGLDQEETEVNQQVTEIKLDENDNPVMPEGWTFLTHGSSLDRWDESLLGNDFVVGNGIVNGQAVSGRPLCCEERSVAKYDYERSGANTARGYGGKHRPFQIRVLYYQNPRTGAGKVVREKLSPEQISKINKCYMYQDGRHPAIPAGTKLSFLKNGDFDEITNTNGNNILWYIPEEYLQQYLEDIEQVQDIGKADTQIIEDNEISQETSEIEIPAITHSEVEQELSEVDMDDISVSDIEAYLADKIPQVYGDRLNKAGIDIGKFLEGQKLRLEYFEGVESYKDIIEELDSILEFAENLREQEDKESGQGTKILEETAQEETTIEETIQQEKGCRLTSINGKSLDGLITTYQNAGIKKTDLSAARDTLAKTKDEREQGLTHAEVQPNKDDSEGR